MKEEEKEKKKKKHPLALSRQARPAAHHSLLFVAATVGLQMYDFYQFSHRLCASTYTVCDGGYQLCQSPVFRVSGLHKCTRCSKWLLFTKLPVNLTKK